MTNDKLFGAAAGYLMLGVAWAYAYNMAQYLDPRAFTARPGEPWRRSRASMTAQPQNNVRAIQRPGPPTDRKRGDASFGAG